MARSVCKRPVPLVEYHKKYPPDHYRCAGCEAAVDPIDERWRMGFNGWEHECPGADLHVGHCPSEPVIVDTGVPTGGTDCGNPVAHTRAD